MVKLISLLPNGNICVKIGRAYFVIAYDTTISYAYSHIKRITRIDPVAIPHNTIPFVLPFEIECVCSNDEQSTHVITFYKGCTLTIETMAYTDNDGNIIGGDEFEVENFKLTKR